MNMGVKRVGNPGQTHSHSAAIRLGVHWLPSLAESGQQLEVVDVERRGVGVEELGWFVVGVREGMWRPRWDGNIVSQFCVDSVTIQAVKAKSPLGDEEGLVVLVGW